MVIATSGAELQAHAKGILIAVSDVQEFIDAQKMGKVPGAQEFIDVHLAQASVLFQESGNMTAKWIPEKGLKELQKMGFQPGSVDLFKKTGKFLNYMHKIKTSEFNEQYFNN